ncbi:MAG: hypothetical protein IT162_20895 [Bryobacterales bacterium]|nr:hypothetical protein [Bryobacterales bacterium]
MTLTIGSQTVSWGPGKITMYDNLTSSAGYPTGDSLYANMSRVAPNGLINGAGFNYIFLGLVDPAEPPLPLAGSRPR